jgi:hypothetical protein
MNFKKKKYLKTLVTYVDCKEYDRKFKIRRIFNIDLVLPKIKYQKEYWF